ncbi:hypothetical protein Aph01nite_73370 [Acrocarpospora phusangensis]|uniref:Gram-positive cocci surface proteins LPxTG domain-containing protein n=1 Tax=Acrocarpospora phusangensis TaxID=1070424 RepID=A0A919USC6_9ACTN|nr:hypothetical protein [Acrocarpospora phusangensis]GIH29027.1 hypothetical protein Aph01nite_73370 [Acrocarpospora phusangensis]
MTFRTRLAGALLAGAAVAAVPAAPAAAHPFGPPSTARISVDGSHVAIAWLAAEDDWVALGQSLGAFENPTTGPVSTALTGEQKLQRSAAVRDYLLGRITVAQGGTPCPGRLESLERLVAQGARFAFDCPRPAVDLDVTVSALTDLNENYRTMLTAETPATPAQALYTARQQTTRLRFTASGGGTTAAVTTVAAGTAAAAAIIGVLALLRVRRRKGGQA